MFFLCTEMMILEGTRHPSKDEMVIFESTITLTGWSMFLTFHILSFYLLKYLGKVFCVAYKKNMII